MLPVRLLGIAAVALASLATAPGGSAGEVELDTRLSHTSIFPERGDRVYLRIGVTGRVEETGRRRPVNLALVIDRSGSMEGDKIVQAREAALMALSRLGPDDIASVVAYNHEVEVLLPATRLTNPTLVREAIDRLYADGNTALYEGTRQGIAEAAKFLARDKVNRVILISDGLANVGPSSPDEVAVLGREAAGKGITISTIGLGLGYNEDLMARLAYNSDGNHAFVERSGDLAGIFDKELGTVLSVAAQEITIEIDCLSGFRPIRVLGREAVIDGRRVTVRYNQLYGGQEKYVLVELAVPEDAGLGERDVADVSVTYSGLTGSTAPTLHSHVSTLVVASPAAAEGGLMKKVMADVATQLATVSSDEAVELRDKGLVEEAKRKLEETASYLDDAATRYAAPALGALAGAKRDEAERVGEADWGRTRKAMRAESHKTKVQQAY